MLFIYSVFVILPRKTALCIASDVAKLLYPFLKKEKRIAFDNLAVIEPDPLKRRLIVKKLFVNIAKNLVDMMRLWWLRRDKLFSVVDVEGEEEVRKLYNSGKGVLVITTHQGAFEYIPAYLAAKGYKVAVVGRRLYDPRLDRMLVSMRKSWGTVNLATDREPEKLSRFLSSGYLLGLLVDLNLRSVKNEKSILFGREVLSPKGPVLLALRSSSPVVPLAIRRTRDDRFKITVLPGFYLLRSGNLDEDVRAGLLLFNRCVESLIMLAVDEWPRTHPRFL